MRLKLTSTFLLAWVCAAAMLFSTAMVRADGEGIKLDAQLIWGTNDATDPNPKHSPVPEDIEKKLQKSPFKWKHYFIVSVVSFGPIAQGKSERQTISKICDIEVTYLGGDKVKIRLYGKGKLVSTVTQDLPKGEIHVTGGNAENSTAWFVLLKRVD